MGCGLILGIESSCDETAAAVVRGGSEALSNVVASQVSLHQRFGGVVPELASREHLRNIVPVVRAAMGEAGVGFEDLDAIAVTEGPGLAGALLVGILYAKALSFGLGKPLVAVNHLEGHIHAVLMEARGSGRQVSEFPILALVVSGGHTHLYLADGEHDIWSYRNVGRTVDDAAGEAYDKVAKLLGLGYPGGPWIDQLSGFGDPAAVPFHFGPIRSKEEGMRFDFSFSGIKTAALRYVELHRMRPQIEARRQTIAEAREMTVEEISKLCDAHTLNLIASFQSAVVGVLIRQTLAAARALGARSILVSGGVAANRELRRRFNTEAAACKIAVMFPTIALSSDNAAMIAAAAWPKLQAAEWAADGMTAEPQLRLGV